MSAKDDVIADLTTKNDNLTAELSKALAAQSSAENSRDSWRRSYEQVQQFRTEDAHTHCKALSDLTQKATKTMAAMADEAADFVQKQEVLNQIKQEQIRTDTIAACFDRVLQKLAE